MNSELNPNICVNPIYAFQKKNLGLEFFIELEFQIARNQTVGLGLSHEIGICRVPKYMQQNRQ